MALFKPSGPAELIDVVAWATAEEQPLEIIGRGTKRRYGRPLQTAHTLDLSALRGIVSYEPAELVLTAAAGTPLAEIEHALTEKGQQLAFEPADYGALLGGDPGRQTIGGVLACNLSGPRRLRQGAARDHFLGFNAVSGRGEGFKAGGRVVKNVTGYDLPKLIAGSHGTLAVMSEVTVKVLPAPEKTRTILVFGLDEQTAIQVLTAALGSPHEVTGAAHLPARIAATLPIDRVTGPGQSVTAIRLEGPGPSVVFRADALRGEFGARGSVDELHTHNSMALWRAVRDAEPFVEEASRLIWRLSVPPATGAAVVSAIVAALGADIRYFFDWGGGLVWLSVPPSVPDGGHEAIRTAVASSGGHATLLRAPDSLRTVIPVFQPQPEALAALSKRVKESFDPRGILNPGRMYLGT
jgi:glycolate oxidase FAD binding subunit